MNLVKRIQRLEELVKELKEESHLLREENQRLRGSFRGSGLSSTASSPV